MLLVTSSQEDDFSNCEIGLNKIIMQNKLSKKQKVIQKIIEGNSIDWVRDNEHVSSRTVIKWLVEFVQNGRNLKSLERQRPIKRQQQLHVGQIEWLYHVLLSKEPKDFGFDRYLWNGHLLEKLIQHWCNKDYPGARVYSLLDDLGFGIQSPIGFKLAPHVVKSFRTVQPKKSQAVYIDYYSLKLGYKVSQSETGGALITRTIPTNTNYCVLYAYNLDKNGKRFIVKQNPLDLDSTCDFVERLSFDLPSPILMITPVNSFFSTPEIIEYINMNFPQIKFFSIATQI